MQAWRSRALNYLTQSVILLLTVKLTFDIFDLRNCDICEFQYFFAHNSWAFDKLFNSFNCHKSNLFVGRSVLQCVEQMTYVVFNGRHSEHKV